MVSGAAGRTGHGKERIRGTLSFGVMEVGRLIEDRVHPDLRSGFAQSQPTSWEDFGSVRTAWLAVNGPLPSAPDVRAVSVPLRDGAPAVRLRLYGLEEGTRGRPALLWIHGGGYALGLSGYDDFQCRRFAREVGCVVAAVDYRLAPEHPYPAGLEDCYAALSWLAADAEGFGIDADRIAIAGSSAGGGLTAALALYARDRKGPHIRFQMPLCPMLDDRNRTASSREITDPRMWDRAKNVKAWRMYLGAAADGQDVPAYAAPARARDLSGLPPTYMSVGELDAFRDETVEYAERLLEAGVATELHVFAGCYHGFDTALSPAISRRAQEEYVTALRTALRQT